MPSFGSGEATAVARTALSPLVVKAAPEACLASLPVSNLMCLPPASSMVMSCFMMFPLFSLSIKSGRLGGDLRLKAKAPPERSRAGREISWARCRKGEGRDRAGAEERKHLRRENLRDRWRLK